MAPYLVAAAIVVIILLSGLRIAQEYQRGVVFRLGRYMGLRGPGLYWIIPLGIERAVTIDIRTRTVSAEQQETITRDSVTIKVNAVLWYRIVDAAKSVIAVADAPAAVYQLALTSLRNIIGQHDLDEVLQERNKINGLLRDNIAGSTTQWGLEVERFEMKDVELPEAMQQVMAMQAEAIREKRARIIKAEAELEASEKLSMAADQMAGNPAALGIAAHADDRGGRRGEQQHDRADDPVGLRHALEKPERIPARAFRRKRPAQNGVMWIGRAGSPFDSRWPDIMLGKSSTSLRFRRPGLAA